MDYDWGLQVIEDILQEKDSLILALSQQNLGYSISIPNNPVEEFGRAFHSGSVNFKYIKLLLKCMHLVCDI